MRTCFATLLGYPEWTGTVREGQVNRSEFRHHPGEDCNAVNTPIAEQAVDIFHNPMSHIGE